MTPIPLVPGFIETMVARNALFVLVTLAYLFNWFQARQRTPIIASHYFSRTRRKAP